MNQDDYDDSDDQPVYMTCSHEPPTWRFDIHDVLGIGSAMLGGIFQNIGAGFGMLSNEFYASARFRRRRAELIEEQRTTDKAFLAMMKHQED